MFELSWDPSIHITSLSPRSGRAHAFGETNIGFRSYEKGECVISIRVRIGVGGKWTCGESNGGIREEDAKGNGLFENVGVGNSGLVELSLVKGKGER